jgi:hypothetical protein
MAEALGAVALVMLGSVLVEHALLAIRGSRRESAPQAPMQARR